MRLFSYFAKPFGWFPKWQSMPAIWQRKHIQNTKSLRSLMMRGGQFTTLCMRCWLVGCSARLILFGAVPKAADSLKIPHLIRDDAFSQNGNGFYCEWACVFSTANECLWKAAAELNAHNLTAEQIRPLQWTAEITKLPDFMKFDWTASNDSANWQCRWHSALGSLN